MRILFPWLMMFPVIVADASIRADKVHVADSKKTEAYLRDGLVVGGDRAIDDVVIRDIRRAGNPGYERVVIDLEGNQAGEPAAIPRPPFFQVAVTPDERRLVLTFWGHPRLAFDPKRVLKSFQKSAVVDKVELLPRVEEQLWTFVIALKDGNPVEVFELNNPVRVIVDIRSKK